MIFNFNSQFNHLHDTNPLTRGDGRFVFQQGGVPHANAPDEEAAAQLERQTRQAQHRDELGAATERAAFAPETKSRMRELLASDSAERQYLVERLINGEITEAEFKTQREQLETDDRTWGTIFRVQRSIRRKIENLQWKAEGYLEILPRQRSTFENLLRSAHALNTNDADNDRGQKRLLSGLVNPTQGARAVLHAEDARAIYEADPTKDSFERTILKYKNMIEAAPNGRSTFRQLMALKREEKQVMMRYERVNNELNQIVERNVSKVKLLAERGYLMKVASKAVGIKLKEGTGIEYTPVDGQDVSTKRRSTRISRIEFEPVERRDSTGKVIERINGVPNIHLSDSGLGKMTLGRFKKWVDATDAVESVSGIGDVEATLDMKKYGMKIVKGMPLAYPRRSRDRGGCIKTQPIFVTITDIKDGKIYFDNPVEYPPGLGRVDQYEMRSWLDFGEFVKWWHRYEVEKSVSLQELRALLLAYNKEENKEWGLELSESPVIFVEAGEVLRYPDDRGTTFQIRSVDTDGVVFENNEKFSLPEFFHWVKNNHVQKVPDCEKTPDEVKKTRTALMTMQKEAEALSKGDEIKEELGKKRQQDANALATDLSAGTVLGKIKELWFTTQFLSFKDLFNMATELKEYVTRKHGVRSKTRYGIVGSRLPWVLGTEFERVRQAASNEEVGKYKEAMEKWGVEKIRNALYKTNVKDVAKACVLTLVAKGDMRWDDHRFWSTLNRLTARYTLKGTELFVPPPDKMPMGRSGEDMIEGAIDELWGKNQFSEWFQENTSHYNSTKNNFEYKFKQLENDPKGTGGPLGECTRMLNDWRSGKHVNAQEYEAMIDGAIKYGKMGAEDKMFFIMAGVLAKQGEAKNRTDGETLLHVDRIGELNSKYTNNFPLLDFFTQILIEDKSMWDDVHKKWGKKRKFNVSDYYMMMKKYFPDDYKKGAAGPQFSRFLWEVMLMEEEVRTRISKGIRNAENMDHDDAHLFIPPTTPGEIDTITSGPTGQKKYFTTAGYANGYPGFNQYFISLSNSIAEEADPDKKKVKVLAVRDALYSFVRYDAILDNRLLREEADRRARLDDRHYQRETVADGSCKLKLHQAQLRNLIIEVGREYGEDFSWLYGEKCGLDQEGRRAQTEYERRINEMKEKVYELIASDNGEKAIKVINRAALRSEANENDEHGLRGIQKSKRPSQKEIDKMREDALVEMSKGGMMSKGH